MIEKTNAGSKYSEDWLPIKQIMNGMIQLDNGEYVTGVKVAPKNIFILSADQQNGTLNSLRNFYNVIDYEFWLIVADRPVDISVYQSQLLVQYNKSTNNAVRKLLMQDINKANMFISNEFNVVDTEYYLIFKEKRMELIQKKIHQLISGLANCGLSSTQTSNDDLRMILDNFFNGGTESNLRTVML